MQSGRRDTRRLLSIAVLSIAVLAAPLATAAQVVSPLQAGHYSPAIKNIRDMANPPSGFFVLWYNAYTFSDQYIDKNGKAFHSIKLDELYPSFPRINVDVDVKGLTTIPAVFWASRFKILGGAKYMAGVSPSYFSIDASIITERGGILQDTTVVRVVSGKNSGFTDMFFAPVGLSWGFTHFDATFLYGFYAPTGTYSSGASDNVGLGFWTHQFQGYGYYYPFTDKSSAVMAGLTYEMNGKIKDADVTPGNRVSLEWGLAQYLSSRFEVGVQGGHNWQVSEDAGEKVYWDKSAYDQKSTLAFNAAYWLWEKRLMVNAKYAFDFGIRQRMQNQAILFNVIFIVQKEKTDEASQQ